MNVVVHVLAAYDSGLAVRTLTLDAGLSVTVALLLLFQAALNSLGIVVLEGAVLDLCHLVVVLLGKGSLVEHWLLRGVVVVLVNLLVDGGGSLFVLATLYSLVGDRRGDLLVDGGVMLARLGAARLSVNSHGASHFRCGTHVNLAIASFALSIVLVVNGSVVVACCGCGCGNEAE